MTLDLLDTLTRFMQNILDLQIRLGLHCLFCRLDSFTEEIRGKNVIVLPAGYQQTPLTLKRY